MSEPIKRFYKEAAAGEGGTVLLDGRPVKTPAKADLRAPTQALAQAIAAEWEGQGDSVRFEAMPLTRLANVALDRTPQARAAIVEMVAQYAFTDLVCHRAEYPQALTDLQAAVWDPLVAWAEHALAAKLPVVAGVIAAEPDEESIRSIVVAAADMDDFTLTGLGHAAGLLGSCVVAFALARGTLNADAAFAAAALDDLYQLQTWGEDAEARARLDLLEREVKALDAWFRALA